MGDRGQVHIKDEGVWLYTHETAYRLVDDVRSALSKKWRWNDPKYLARVVFDRMVGDKKGKEFDFGISSRGPNGDEWRIIELDCAAQRITVKDNGEVTIDESFSDFIESAT
jgi:hypothetical protein